MATPGGDFHYYIDKRDNNGKRFINPDGCTFFLFPFGPSEVDKIIDELNVKKSTGLSASQFSLRKISKYSFRFGYHILLTYLLRLVFLPMFLKFPESILCIKKKVKLDITTTGQYRFP